MLHRPFVEIARYCAQKRNYYWEYERATTKDKTIIIPKWVGPYPLKSDQISDRAASDSGGNFGRLARYGLMDSYIDGMHATRVRGISVMDWLKFFKSNATEK